ncbi:MAG: hypothetical protein IKD93_01915 [Firmicutes bacterium]|nr:hypothetical protein [Bacillota bacterium]
MSQFAKYAQELDKIARSAFAEYQKAEAALKAAEEEARQFPERSGSVSDDYRARSIRAKAALVEAKTAMKAAKAALQSHESEISSLRRELAGDIDRAYSADPAQLDHDTITLLESGILRPGEYTRLLKNAQEAGNTTMMRLVGKYAGERAETEAKAGGQYSDDVRELRQVFHASKQTTGAEHLERFDYLTEVFNRGAHTPELAGLPDRWNQLTADVIENF